MTRTTSATPKGALCYIQGTYYKIGIHNFTYYWKGSEWYKSNYTAEELERALRRVRNVFDHTNTF